MLLRPTLGQALGSPRAGRGRPGDKAVGSENLIHFDDVGSPLRAGGWTIERKHARATVIAWSRKGPASHGNPHSGLLRAGDVTDTAVGAEVHLAKAGPGEPVLIYSVTT